VSVVLSAWQEDIERRLGAIEARLASVPKITNPHGGDDLGVVLRRLINEINALVDALHGEQEDR
jgi:hypothetical protein